MSKNSIDENIKKSKSERCNINDEKYQVLLKFINVILLNIGKPQIDNFIKFTGIERNDIIVKENREALNKMKKELFAHYNATKCGLYRKTPAMVLNCLRGMVKEAGYKLLKVQKNKSVKIDNKKYQQYIMVYSILEI